MEIEHHEKEGILIITPKLKDLHAKIVPQFKEQLAQILDNLPASHVILDLHYLDHMDSSGISSLLALFRRLNSQERELKFACVSRSLRTLFELVSMHKLFKIYNTLEDAFNSCKLKTGA
jgi:anti-anti-sigma factor